MSLLDRPGPGGNRRRRTARSGNRPARPSERDAIRGRSRPNSLADQPGRNRRAHVGRRQVDAQPSTGHRRSGTGDRRQSQVLPTPASPVSSIGTDRIRASRQSSSAGRPARQDERLVGGRSGCVRRASASVRVVGRSIALPFRASGNLADQFARPETCSPRQAGRIDPGRGWIGHTRAWPMKGLSERFSPGLNRETASKGDAPARGWGGAARRHG